MRSKGVGLSTASNWINNFFVGLLTPSLIAASPRSVFQCSLFLRYDQRVVLRCSGTYVVFALACLGAFFWSWLVVPETKGRSLEEMDTLFNSDAGAESAHHKHEVSKLVLLEARFIPLNCTLFRRLNKLLVFGDKLRGHCTTHSKLNTYGLIAATRVMSLKLETNELWPP